MTRILTAAGAAALFSVAGCFDLGLGSGNGCVATCETSTWISPYGANLLIGDTVRFTACNDMNACDGPGDTGNVPSRWSVADAKVVTFVSDSSPIVVSSATSVLMRGIAPGVVTLNVTFSKGSGYVPKQSIRVADSSEIKSIALLNSFGDTARVNVVRDFGVQLLAANGVIFRGAPTSFWSSDTTVLKVTQTANNPGAYNSGTVELHVTGLKPGTAYFSAAFLGVTATRVLTVVP